MCHCGNTGVEQTQNKSQHTKSTLDTKKARPGFELITFQSWVRRSYQQAIPALLTVQVSHDATSGGEAPHLPDVQQRVPCAVTPEDAHAAAPQRALRLPAVRQSVFSEPIPAQALEDAQHRKTRLLPCIVIFLGFFDYLFILFFFCAFARAGIGLLY